MLPVQSVQNLLRQELLLTMLPPATLAPALRSLCELVLVNVGITDIPRGIMRCLDKRLKLDVSHNLFVALPAALEELTTLEVLITSPPNLLHAINLYRPVERLHFRNVSET